MLQCYGALYTLAAGGHIPHTTSEKRVERWEKMSQSGKGIHPRTGKESICQLCTILDDYRTMLQLPV
jgi:hypothetical protein